MIELFIAIVPQKYIMDHMVSIARIFNQRSWRADLQLPMDFFRPCSSAKTGAEYAGTVGNLLVQKGPIFLISILMSFFLFYFISLPLANSVIVMGMPVIKRELTIQSFYLGELIGNVRTVLVQTAYRIFVVSSQCLQMQIAQACASLQCSQLIDSFDQIPFQIQIDQFSAVAQRIYIWYAIFRKVNDPQPRVTLQRRETVNIVLAEIEHHKVCALRQGINTGNALTRQRDCEDDLRRKFIGQSFEDRNIDLSGEVVFFLAELREIPEFLDIDIAHIRSKQFRADIVVLYLSLALFRHRYILSPCHQSNIASESI